MLAVKGTVVSCVNELGAQDKRVRCAISTPSRPGRFTLIWRSAEGGFLARLDSVVRVTCVCNALSVCTLYSIVYTLPLTTPSHFHHPLCLAESNRFFFFTLQWSETPFSVIPHSTKNTIYVLPEMKTVRPPSQILHSWICERFIHSQDRSAAK
jgi:hypothetical protein